MNKAYNKITWQNKPSTATPLNQTNLNEMSNALDTIDDRVIALDSGKVGSVTVTNTLQTGDTIATITVDGTATNIKSAQVEVDAEPSATSENPLQNKAIYEMLNNLLPEETAEGNPISISDASGLNAKACSVDLLPIQDLHGYDSPWVGGAGKNKFPLNINLDDSSYTHVYNLSTYPELADFFAFLEANKGSNAIWSCSVTGEGSNIGMIVIRTGSTPIATYRINSFQAIPNSDYTTANQVIIYGSTTGATIKNCQFELGTTATSYAPYSNICPITGRNSVKVKRTGVNQWDEQWESGTYRSADGTPTGDANRIRTKNRIEVFSDSLYFVTFTNAIFFMYDENDEYLGYKNRNVSGIITPITWYEGTKYIRFSIGSSSNPVTTYTGGVAINYPSTYTDYEPYQGETYTETLGQTVYGGKADFVSGEGQNDYEYLTPTSVGAVAQSGGLYYCIINSGIHSYNNANVISSHFVKGSLALGKCYITANGTTLVFVLPDQTLTTKAQIDTWLQNNNVQFAIPLATPTTLTLTPTQIALLRGNNVVSTDGDNIILKYSADIKAWVENQLQS